MCRIAPRGRMNSGRQPAPVRVLLLGAGVAAVLAVWLACVPRVPFFCDLPLQMTAIRDGSMVIQFPGYAPWHLLVRGVAEAIGSLNPAFLSLSMLLSGLAVVQVILTVTLLAGRVGLPVGLMFSLQIFTVYFATSGSTYPADSAAVSGLLLFGIWQLRRVNPTAYYGALAWFCVGVMIRPLSVALALPGLLFLIWKHPRSLKVSLITGAALMLTGLAYLALSLLFYDSIRDFLTHQNTPGVMLASSLEHPGLNSLMGNWFRLTCYLGYGFAAWILLFACLLWRKRRSIRWDGFALLFFTSILYLGAISIHLPQAGYLCFLAPVIVVAPFLVFRDLRVSRNGGAVFMVLGLIVSGFQLFALGPFPPTGKPSAALNAYALQYSRAGIERGRFDTLASLLYRSGIALEDIPPERKALIQQRLDEEAATGSANGE